jgi:hypothetical protein
MANPEISLAISATSFGLVIGFFAGYATRAYMSYVRRRSKGWAASSSGSSRQSHDDHPVPLQSPEANRRVKSKLGE